MKKNFASCSILLFIFLSMLFISCKNKISIPPEDIHTETENQTETETKTDAETETPVFLPEKPFAIEKGISKFYTDGRLADTMYVNSRNGLLIRKAGNSSAEKIGRIPNGFPAKIVALGNKEKIDGNKSYWVQIVVPDYTGEKKEPEFGWVFGEFLSIELPPFSAPKSENELADYISEMPVLLYNNWWPDSVFAKGRNIFFFYHDGNFDYYIENSEEDIEKKASGKWHADSAKHISLKAEDLTMSGFYVFNPSENSFDVPDTDNDNDKFIAKGQRNISFGFANERILKNYKYASRINEEQNYEKETSVSIREEAYKDYETELLASGVDLAGTQYEEKYHNYWNPIRAKNKIHPVELSNAVEFGFDIPYSIEGIGCYVTPYENNSFKVYSDCYKDSEVKGILEHGQTGIVKQVYTKMGPPIPYTWMKIVILDDGTEGWILSHSDDPELMTTYKRTDDEKYSFETNTMNASISHSKTSMKTEQEAKGIAVSPSGNYILQYRDSTAILFQKNSEKPLVISETISDASNMTFSQDESKIYFARKNGSIVVTDLLMESVEAIYEIKAEEGYRYKNPSQIAVTPDQKFIYMELTKDSSSRTLSQIICYDTEKERVHEFDIRTTHDYGNGLNYYSKIVINENNEALVWAHNGDGALVRFTPQENGEIALKQLNFEHTDFEQPGFSPDNDGYILFSNTPKHFVKISNDGQIIEDSRKFLPDSRIDFTHGTETVIYNKDYSIAALLSEAYKETPQYLTFYSTKTFNPLYTIVIDSLDSYSTSCFWTDKGMVIYDSENGDVDFHELKIREKEEQVTVSPKVTPRLLEICKGISHIYREGVHGMTIGFSPFGQYIVTSYIHDYDDSNLGYMSGSYKLDGPVNVILNKAFAFGPDLETFVVNKENEIYHGFSPANGRSTEIEISGTDSSGNLKIFMFEFAK